MERLTTRNIAGVAVYKNPFECDRCGDTIWRLPDCGNGSPTEKLADYEDAEEQGLLLRFPVPIGTTVYKFEPLAKGTKRYIKTTVTRYEVFNDSVWFTFANGLGRNVEDFGEYVFLTQEEAEQKLSEIEEKELEENIEL